LLFLQRLKWAKFAVSARGAGARDGQNANRLTGSRAPHANILTLGLRI
jgi:hypothetical protein